MRFGAIVFLTATLVVSQAMGANLDSQDERVLAEFFERAIRPLFAKHCYECHSADTAKDSGQLALDGREGLLAGGTRGPIFTAGKAEESLLIAAIRYSDPKLQMPPEGKLATPEIELLVEWIQKGGYVPEYGSAPRKKEKEIDWTAAREFWSFKPLTKKQPRSFDRIIPSRENHASLEPSPVAWEPLQIIDVFIHDELEQHGLIPSPSADRRTLARRLSFDLLGIPPDDENLLQFINDENPDAYERLVDRILASPHFGERWARYWLDLVRYTDVTPVWLKNADQAWLYRDWVVRAINEDLPYDDFVTRQLAADTLENTSPDDYAALGLIGLSPTYWKELRLAPSVIEVIVADEWDERIDAVTRTFLGLTVACARCHDHKFDPITSRDYYALAGVFASTQLSDRPLLPFPLAEQIAEARANVGKLEESLKLLKEKDSDEAKKLKSDIEAIRQSTPQFDARMAHTVEEASLFVLPDGPEMTKLDIRKRQPRDLPVFRRGNPGNPGEIVPRRFIEVLSPPEPRPFSSGSGRREFAQSLFREARGLTARVMVNRIWTHHFGRGLVRTPSDFGVQGERPSHPELLEWLASDFAGGDDLNSSRPPAWTLKRLHRQMVTSATYRQRSSPIPTDRNVECFVERSIRLDPENEWVSRMSRRRLDIEPWRDAMLCASGKLDPTLGGPPIELDLPTNVRRTLYGKIGRDEQNDLLRLFDFPPPTSHSPARDVTTTPLQQLFVLNSEFIESQSSALTARIRANSPEIATREMLIRCYHALFQRAPSDAEIQIGERFLEESSASGSHSTDRWPIYVQSLLGLNELLLVD